MEYGVTAAAAVVLNAYDQAEDRRRVVSSEGRGRPVRSSAGETTVYGQHLADANSLAPRRANFPRPGSVRGIRSSVTRNPAPPLSKSWRDRRFHTKWTSRRLDWNELMDMEAAPTGTPRLRPGEVRDAIEEVLGSVERLSVKEIHTSVEVRLGRSVPKSSVRSYLNLNAGHNGRFERVKRGIYKLR